MTLLNELVYLCKLIGSDFEMSQAGGGNISIKSSDDLFIKSSGLILSEVEENFGMTPIPLKEGQDFTNKLNHIDEVSYGKELEAIAKPGSLRPSMESPLHILLKKKYIIHCHPIAVLALSSSTSGEAKLKEIFPTAAWVPYSSPGLKLARYFKKSVDLNQNIYFMQNHGLIIAHDSKEAAIELLISTVDKCKKLCGIDSSGEISNILSFIYNQFNITTSLLKTNDKELLENDLTDYFAICPDDVVYMGDKVLIMSKDFKQELKDFFNSTTKLPSVFRFENRTYILASNIKKCRLIEEQLRANILARTYFKCDHKLDQSEVNFLSNWEAEKYRSKGK